MKRILITGGAGFAGSNLAIRFKQHLANTTIVCFDNLKRRGSELSLPRLKAAGIEFVHGDVRVKGDIMEVGPVDLVVDCAAEPSVLAGLGGSPAYVIDTNFSGTINCLELARTQGAKLVFLSTSRVYPVAPINGLNYEETETRFEMPADQLIVGASEHGIAESFPLDGARSLYGASKLASEFFIQEYIDSYGLEAIINRCGVLTGPWQMGKIDQGVTVLWIAKHLFEKELAYIGYGGTGKQVRDILHIDDLFELLLLQLKDIKRFNGQIFNVGGGREVSVSLQELTKLCQFATGRSIKIDSQLENRPNDLISYITDIRRVSAATGWRPQHSVEQIVTEIARWISDNRVALAPILA